MPTTIVCLLLLWSTLSFAQDVDTKRLAPEREAALRKDFLSEVSEDLATRKESIIKRHIVLANLIAEAQRVLEEFQSESDALKKGALSRPELLRYKTLKIQSGSLAQSIERARDVHSLAFSSIAL